MSGHGLLAEKKRTCYFALCLPNLASGRKTLTGKRKRGRMAALLPAICVDFSHWMIPTLLLPIILASLLDKNETGIMTCVLVYMSNNKA